MPALRIILGDQLNNRVSSLADYQDGDTVLMAEVMSEATYVRHHKQKIAFIFSAMRHFARELEQAGREVRYIALDDPENSGSLAGEVERALTDQDFDRLVITECGEWRLAEEIRGWQEQFDLPVEILPDDRFICSHEEFRDWADGRKALRMEYFYREMRKKTGLLMDGDAPAGGDWNYDAQNRKRLPQKYAPPERIGRRHDGTTRAVMSLVEDHFADHFGSLDTFIYGVTRDTALRELDWFIAEALPDFGDYQDAMATGQDFLNHSVLSAYLNVGLLLPMEVCEAAADACRAGRVPLNAAEGFIRQIIGWREFVRGLYWSKMPDYADTNFFNAQRRLPSFYWTGETDMHCLAEAVRNTRDHAYAHHIQRLMVTGNFALLTGISPAEINEWYLIVYADAFEWVQLPNTHGMATYADGGKMGSKPYAASGAYINRMSDYCGQCHYKVKAKHGDEACPFNYLYWDFIIRNRKKLEGNGRMNLVYKNLDDRDTEEVAAIRKSARKFLNSLD